MQFTPSNHPRALSDSLKSETMRVFPGLFKAVKDARCQRCYDTWLCCQHWNRKHGGCGWLTVPEAIQAVLALNPGMSEKAARNRVYQLLADDRFASRSGHVICLVAAKSVHEALEPRRERPDDVLVELCLSVKARRRAHLAGYQRNRQRDDGRTQDPISKLKNDILVARGLRRPSLAERRGPKTPPLPLWKIKRDMGLCRATVKSYVEELGPIVQVTRNVANLVIQEENGTSTEFRAFSDDPEIEHQQGIYHHDDDTYQRAAHSYSVSPAVTPASRYALRRVRSEVPNMGELNAGHGWHIDELKYAKDNRACWRKSLLRKVEPGRDEWLRVMHLVRH